MENPYVLRYKLAEVKSVSLVISTKYRGMIGSLLYLTASRPDIMFSVFLCARFQEAPKTSHLEAVKRIFRYIKGTTHLGLWYPKGFGIETIVYVDSDHAGDYVDRKSTSGICTFVGCCLTTWFSKKQTALAISTTEAEYVSTGKACQQALLMKQALIDLQRIDSECHVPLMWRQTRRGMMEQHSINLMCPLLLLLVVSGRGFFLCRDTDTSSNKEASRRKYMTAKGGKSLEMSLKSSIDHRTRNMVRELGVSFSQEDAWAILRFHPKWDAPEQVDLTGDVPGATQEDLFGHDARPRPAGKPRPAKKTKSDATASTGGSSVSTQFGELMEQELRLKQEAAERAFEAQAEKDGTLMRLEALRFLATSTKDLDDDDAYWIKKQKQLIKNKMRNDLGDEDDEDEDG
ncbi:hypothetical protein Tco_0712516 [Tanacetum coccineum]